MKFLNCFKILVLVCLLFMPHFVLAQIYYWEDQNGVKHDSSTPPENREGIRDYKVYSTTSDVNEEEMEPANSTSLQNPVSVSQKKKTPKVIIYTTSWCGVCKKAKAWMNQNRVPYQEFDVEASEANYQKYKAEGGDGGVPLILVGNNKMRGWSEETMREWLGM